MANPQTAAECRQRLIDIVNNGHITSFDGKLIQTLGDVPTEQQITEAWARMTPPTSTLITDE